MEGIMHMHDVGAGHAVAFSLLAFLCGFMIGNLVLIAMWWLL